MAPKPHTKILIWKDYYTKSSYCNSYRNIDMENIKPPNHIERKSIKFHMKPAFYAIIG